MLTEQSYPTALEDKQKTLFHPYALGIEKGS